MAIAHYQGKVHAKQKNRKEAGLMVKSDYKVKEDPTGRFGFGKTFIKAKETTGIVFESALADISRMGILF